MSRVFRRFAADQYVRAVFGLSILGGMFIAAAILEEGRRGSEIAAIVYSIVFVACIIGCATLIWLVNLESEGWRRLGLLINLITFGACAYKIILPWQWRSATMEPFFTDVFFPMVGTMAAVSFSYLVLIRIGKWLVEGFSKNPTS